MKSRRETSEIDLDAIVERRNAYYLTQANRIANGCACVQEAMCDLCSAEAAASDNFFSHIEEDEGDLIREVERLRSQSARFVPRSGLCR